MNFSKNRRIAKECPCGKSNHDLKFAPYENMPKHGYCHACDKTYSPDNSVIAEPIKWKFTKVEPSYIDKVLFNKSVDSAANTSNSFLKFISNKYGIENSQNIQKKFKIGNSSRWSESCVFWQIDEKHNIRSGKILRYDSLTGKRDKLKNDWVHSVLLRKKIIESFLLKQCLFGLHQIHGLSNHQLQDITIAIVESAKSACIMSILCPSVIWMSCESLHGLKSHKIQPIKPCKIIMFPDLGDGERNPYNLWNEKSLQLNKFGYNTRVSALLITNATSTQIYEKQDIADFFI